MKKAITPDNFAIEKSCLAIRKLKKCIVEFSQEYAEYLQTNNLYDDVINEICSLNLTKTEDKKEEVKQEPKKNDRQKRNRNWCTHEWYALEDFAGVELDEEVVKELNEILERHFSRKIILTKDIDKLSESGISSIDRIMRFAHLLGLSLSKDGVKEFKTAFSTILESDKFEWTNKMLEKEAIDIKLEEDNSVKKSSNKKKNYEYTKDDWDAFGYLELVKDLKKALSSKNTDLLIECIAVILETYPFASLIVQKEVNKVIEKASEHISKSIL